MDQYLQFSHFYLNVLPFGILCSKSVENTWDYEDNQFGNNLTEAKQITTTPNVFPKFGFNSRNMRKAVEIVILFRIHFRIVTQEHVMVTNAEAKYLILDMVSSACPSSRHLL